MTRHSKTGDHPVLAAALAKLGVAQPVSMTTKAAGASPQEIAGSVRRPGKHQFLEHQLGELRDAAARLRQRANEVRESSMLDDRKEKALKDIGREQEKSDADLRECRSALAPYRIEHASRVENALHPMRSAAARRVQQAADALRLELASLNAINSEGRRFGCDMPTVHVRDLDGIDDDLRGLL